MCRVGLKADLRNSGRNSQFRGEVEEGKCRPQAEESKAGFGLLYFAFWCRRLIT